MRQHNPQTYNEQRHLQRLMKLYEKQKRNMISIPITLQQKKNALEIKADRSHDKLIGRKPIVDEIRIIDNVPAENQTSADRHY
jgi:hypothetical protein